jgi:hypothetical protein
MTGHFIGQGSSLRLIHHLWNGIPLSSLFTLGSAQSGLGFYTMQVVGAQSFGQPVGNLPCIYAKHAMMVIL